jgi:3-oxoacyl-[acyl-carrier-protein] synthase II
MSRRVVITGLGVVTSLGETVDAMWEALCAGKSGIGLISRWDTSKYPVRIGGECKTFDITQYGVDGREAKRLDRFGQFGMAASISAIKDAGLDFDKEDRTRCGVDIGSGIGGLETLEEQNHILWSRGVGRVSPFTVPRLMVNAAAGNVSIRFGLQGPNTAVATACATGSNAIGDAGRFITYGMADVMIAGGSEAAVCQLAPSQRGMMIPRPPADPGIRIAMGSSWAKGPGSSCLRNTSAPSAGEPGFTPNWWVMA